MVNLILKYLEQPMLAYMPYLNKVDSPVVRLSSGKIYKGNGSEKEEISISDTSGNSLYIRQLSPESISEIKSVSSCDKLYEVKTRCKAVFYTFGSNDFTVSPDKVKSSMQSALNKIRFNQYTGSASDISITINSATLDIEKIFKDETGQTFSGNEWPVLVAIEFTLTYEDVNCVPCDIDDAENPVTWTPDFTPENCETKAICEAVAACDVIKDLQAETVSLQEQIDNLPQSGLTCTDLPNCQTIIDILQSINDIISGLPSSYFSCADLEFCQTIIDIVSDISALQTQVGTNTTDISTLQGQVSSLISDLGTLTTTVNNHISDTSNPHNVTLEQARSENSSISGDINANNNTIINLKDAVNPQEPITKIQFDTYVSAVGGNRGPIDCSTNPNYPASNKGDRWEVTVAGKIGGPSGINVDVYDEIVCVTASASGDQATVGVNFYIVQGNIERATETTNGYTSYATDAETQSGTNNTKTITPLKLYNWFVALVQSIFVKKGTITNNTILKGSGTDTATDSSITDDGTTVTVNNKLSVLKNTVGTGQKGLSINFNTIGEVFYIDDNGYLVYNANAGATFKGGNGIVDIVSNGGTEPILTFKYNNGSNTSGSIYGQSGSLFIDSPILNLPQLTASQIVETDSSKNLVSAAKGTAYNKDFGTGTTNIPEIGTTLTADKVLITDASSKLKPSTISTTTLGYLDATSSIQTQLATKANNLIYKINTPITHTGTTAETILNPSTFLSGFKANDFLMIDLRWAAINNANTKTIKVYVNTSHSLVGATKIATIAGTANISGYVWLTRELQFNNSLSSTNVFGPTTAYTTDISGTSTTAPTTLTFDFTSGCYFIITGILNASAADTITIRGLKLRLNR